MIKKFLRAIHDLKIFLFGIITAFFFFTYCAEPLSLLDWLFRQVSWAAGSGVGSSAQVEANPYNSLAAQLAAKEKDLAEREASIIRKDSDKSGDTEENLLAVAILALFFLILTNYYLDFRSRRPSIMPGRPVRS
jgi:hypothetical protein